MKESRLEQHHSQTWHNYWFVLRTAFETDMHNDVDSIYRRDAIIHTVIEAGSSLAASRNIMPITNSVKAA